MNTELCLQSAIELVRLIKTREVSAVEVLAAHLAQIETVNPSVNAIVTLAPDHAMDLAKIIDERLAAGQPVGTLAGLPVAHKDLADTRGIRTTYGSRLYENHVPESDALVVSRLVEAGAVTLGKTNTPEWGAGSQTFNEVFGATRNPYDVTKTCGGSSGGAAVALASRMVPIADGSDLGGSLRNPANFCNVVGFRTSAGRVPVLEPNGYFSPSIVGPMARTVADCALMLSAISGPDPGAPLSLPRQNPNFEDALARDFAGTRVAISPDFGGQIPVVPAVRSIIESAAATLSGIGCEVDVACPDFEGADPVFKTLRAWSMASRHREGIAKHPDLYKDTIVWNVQQGLNLTAEDIYRTEVARTQLFRRMQSFMSEYEYLVLPVSQVPPFDINLEYVTGIEDVTMATYIDWMKSCYLISATGLPAISVPGGFTPEGLPVGVQIVGRHQQDLSVLALASAFEMQTGHWQTLPGVLNDRP